MKKTIIGLGALALIAGAIGLSAKTSLAYQGEANIKGPNYSAERHEAMIKALETKDYNAWKTLMSSRSRLAQVVNETNFPKFVQAHELMLQGKTAEAQEIRQELGLGAGGCRGAGKVISGTGMGRGWNR